MCWCCSSSAGSSPGLPGERPRVRPVLGVGGGAGSNASPGPQRATRWPESFIWGTATAAHQVEGGNWNSDWWAWEHNPLSPCTEPSGDACDHYHRYESDVELIAELGFNAYRFSIEWARIEPEEGEFSKAQLEHYRRVLGTCHEKGLLPVVTFHHFTSPRWIARRGGWEDPSTAELFARFCKKAAAHLGDLVGIGCTVNEPNIAALHGYETGMFPPGKRDPSARDRATATLAAGHRRAREVFKEAAPDVPVGLTLAMSEYRAVDGGEEKLKEIRARSEGAFLDAAQGDDFIGVQTYTRLTVGPTGQVAPGEGVEKTLMGWEYRPEALEVTIPRAYDATGGTPVLVTENGIATDDDARRIAFVERALQAIGMCRDQGVDVRGYFYWSALDNFEWAYGYRPAFGLIAVDPATFERAAKPSARWLGGIARTNAPPAPTTPG